LKIKKITQQNFFLSILENYVRRNLYIFIFLRYVVGEYLYFFIHETDFKILRSLNNIKNFNKKDIIDIGGNDGISVKTIRKYIASKIISFEPLKNNYNKINKLKKKFSPLNTYNYALSDQAKKFYIYVPYFKNFNLSPYASLQKEDVLKGLKDTLPVKNILKKINIKKSIIKTKKLDELNLKPSFIKIDIQGHEYKCIKGSLKTIKKYKPIIMIEYEKKSIIKINNILKKYGYKKFIYKAKLNSLKKHNNEKILNIFFIDKKNINKISLDTSIKIHH
jgi:FkbM family methyltransferase